MHARQIIMHLVLAGFAAAGCAQAASSPTGGASIAAQPVWSSSGQAFSVQLTSLDGDHVRAFFENMGYPAGAVNAVASVCVFGTTIRNATRGPVSYDVAQWRALTADGVRHRLITKTQWLARWRPFGVNADWSILPPQQTLQSGDWGQGFTTVDLPPGTHFRLLYSWREHATMHHATVHAVQCAARRSSP
ncbi:hypothetical protein [Thiomonas sp. FB-Cd]|uniref:hypothetical protein n=1 Tax=Thiomonas sp. FB-Cd TaxID=1158292 RepID=UPI0004DEDA02|nr:hypothetical protein [Thiomonas sp. FB-Cd]